MNPERRAQLARMLEADGMVWTTDEVVEAAYGAELDRVLARGPVWGMCPAAGCVRGPEEHHVHRDDDGCEWRVEDPVDYVVRAHGVCIRARGTSPSAAYLRAQLAPQRAATPVDGPSMDAQLAEAEARGRAQIIDAVTRAIADGGHACSAGAILDAIANLAPEGAPA